VRREESLMAGFLARMGRLENDGREQQADLFWLDTLDLGLVSNG
jgi:hypothetical protein